jgi:hypothetical protein
MKHLPIIVLGGIVGLAVFFTVLFPLEPNDISQQITGLSLSALTPSELSVTQTRTSTGCPVATIKTSSGSCLKLPPNGYTKNIDLKCNSLFPQGYTNAKNQFYLLKNIPTKGCFPISAIQVTDNNRCTYRELINKDVAVACKASGSFRDVTKVYKPVLITEPCPAGYQKTALGQCVQLGSGTGFSNLWCVIGTKWAQCNTTAIFPAFAKPLPSTILSTIENQKAIIDNFLQQIKKPTTTVICGAGFFKNSQGACEKIQSCPTGFMKTTLGTCFKIP